MAPDSCRKRSVPSSSLDKEYRWHMIYIIKKIKVPEFKKVKSASAAASGSTCKCERCNRWMKCRRWKRVKIWCDELHACVGCVIVVILRLFCISLFRNEALVYLNKNVCYFCKAILKTSPRMEEFNTWSAFIMLGLWAMIVLKFSASNLIYPTFACLCW